jgi:hypothetical protein
MSTSYHIRMIRSEDDPGYQKMLAVKKACDEAGVKWPQEVSNYFDGCDDEIAPLEIPFDDEACEWSEYGARGFEIAVDDIPKDTKRIRFYCSW